MNESIIIVISWWKKKEKPIIKTVRCYYVRLNGDKANICSVIDKTKPNYSSDEELTKGTITFKAEDPNLEDSDG